MKAAAVLGAIIFVVTAEASAEDSKNLNWPVYGHDLANTRFQDVDQINPSNAAQMRVAWVFHTGVLDPNAKLEVSPVEVDGSLYITDGHDDVFALNATTGSQKWSYKPTQIPGEMPSLDQVFVCCGLNKSPTDSSPLILWATPSSRSPCLESNLRWFSLMLSRSRHRKPALTHVQGESYETSH